MESRVVMMQLKREPERTKACAGPPAEYFVIAGPFHLAFNVQWLYLMSYICLNRLLVQDGQVKAR
jgi:hypothetical protein